MARNSNGFRSNATSQNQGNSQKFNSPVAHGMSEDDVIDFSGSVADLRILGKRGDDDLSGGSGNDLIVGGPGSDTMNGGEGDDTIVGASGDDRALFDGSILDFSITETDDGWNVTDLNTADGDEGSDTFENVETLQFDDFTLHLDGTNNAPLIVASDQITTEDGPTTFTVQVYDFDGDALSVDDISVTGPGGLTLDSTTTLSPALGSGLELTFTYDPDDNYETLGVGDSATESVTIEVSDGNGGTTSVSHDIVITGVNDAPVADDDIVVTDEDVGIDIDVLDNDFDIDGDSLTVTSASAVNGSVVINPDGTLGYTPNDEFFGTDTITYEISDGEGGTDTATVDVTVTPVNDAPVAGDSSSTHEEDDGLIIIDLAALVTDVDDTTFTFSGIEIVRNGTPIPFTTSSDGQIVIDPEVLGLDDGESITTTFNYTATDGSGASGSGQVTVTINGADEVIVTPTNNPPVAGTLTVTADEEDGLIEIPLSSFVSDPDVGDVLTITNLTTNFAFGTTVSSLPVTFTGGVLTGEGGSIAFDPEFFGLDEGEFQSISLTYTVEDAAGLTATNTITLNLTGHSDATGNTPPVAEDLADEIIVDDPAVLTYTVDLNDLISDAETANTNLTLSLGDLVIGLDEATGTPITVPYSFDPVTRELTITLSDVGVGDGESIVGSLEYTVSDGTAEDAGQLALTFVNPEEPAPETQVTIDFEEFSDPLDSSIDLTDLTVSGLTFLGSAVVVETDEIGGGGRTISELGNGQTTVGGDNILVGTFSTAEVPVLDPVTGDPILDENGNPVTQTVVDQPFTAAAQGVGDLDGLGTLIGFGAAGTPPTPTQEQIDAMGDTFDLDGLSLNVASGGETTVYITTYIVEVVEVTYEPSPSLSQYYLQYVEADTFEFVVDSSTPADQIDLNSFVDATGNSDSTAFDDIYAFTISTGGELDDPAVTLDDILITM